MIRTSGEARSGSRVRRSLAATAAVAISGALAACSGGGNAGESGVQDGSLQMYTWIGGDSDREQWQAYIDAGAETDPDVSVTFSGPPIGDFYTKLPTILSGSDAPCIVTLQNGQVNPYVSALEPLGPLADAAGTDLDAYDHAMIEQLSVDGELYALP